MHSRSRAAEKRTSTTSTQNPFKMSTPVVDETLSDNKFRPRFTCLKTHNYTVSSILEVTRFHFQLLLFSKMFPLYTVVVVHQCWRYTPTFLSSNKLTHMILISSLNILPFSELDSNTFVLLKGMFSSESESK